jgi:hypothetical protein
LVLVIVVLDNIYVGGDPGELENDTERKMW